MVSSTTLHARVVLVVVEVPTGHSTISDVKPIVAGRVSSIDRNNPTVSDQALYLKIATSYAMAGNFAESQKWLNSVKNVHADKLDRLLKLYDESYYRAENFDVVKGVSNGTLKSALYHFIHFGIFEGRKPSANPGPEYKEFAGLPDLPVLLEAEITTYILSNMLAGEIARGTGDLDKAQQAVDTYLNNMTAGKVLLIPSY